VNVSDSTLDGLRRDHPILAQSTIETASRVVRHEFNLLGSGPYTPVDPERPADAFGYRPIDWHLDPISGLRFRQEFPRRMEPGAGVLRAGRRQAALGLSRRQHWPVLGQAYRLTGDGTVVPKRARAARFEAIRWNRGELSRRWMSARAANWAIGLELIRACPSLGPDFWHEAYAALFEHGSSHRTPPGDSFRRDEQSLPQQISSVCSSWRRYSTICRGAGCGRPVPLVARAGNGDQIQEDGSDFESSVPYHRLVTELFFPARGWTIGRRCRRDMRRRLITMVEFFAVVQRPDGLMPQIGDATTGGCILSGYGRRGHRTGGICSARRAVFSRSRVDRARNEWTAWETVW
jgi:hypothetical protein